MSVPVKPKKFRGQRFGPFRGPTPKGVVQTLDVGVGGPNFAGVKRFKANSERNPERKYVGIDPEFEHPLIMDNYELNGNRLVQEVKELVKKGIKVRRINFTYPSPNLNLYNIKEFLELLPKVLLPNGKVYVVSELNKSGIDFLIKFNLMAKSLKFGTKMIKKFRDSDLKKINDQAIEVERLKKLGIFIEKRVNNLPMTGMQQIMYGYGDNLIKSGILEITYTLKQAYPNKERRRVWPH